MSKFKNLSPLLRSFVEKGPAGCACSVTQNGKVKYQECFGYADLETKTPITPDTIYRIFSMTKVITCTAALILYERGLYLLNDPLERQAMARCARKLIDGRGPDRLVTGLEVMLHPTRTLDFSEAA